MNAVNILLVYPEVPETFWSCTHALKFFNKRANTPPLGLLTVAAMLPPHFKRRLRDLNVEPLHPEDLAWAHYVFLSAMTVQRDSAHRVIDQCKKAGIQVVAGGPLFNTEPENFSDVDHLLLNEAELTLPEFLNDLANGHPKKRYLSFDFADLHTSPVPAYELLDLRAYASPSVQWSRGCPNSCDFCDVTALFGTRPRTKTAQQIIAELNGIYDLGWRGWILFADDNLVCDKPRLKRELLPAIIRWKRDKPSISFHTQISINVVDDPELLQLLHEAGFHWVFVGFESPHEPSLQECRKKQNLHRNMSDQVRRLQQSGLHVQGGFIVGFDHDPADIFSQQFRFIQENGIVMAMVGLLQALPGTRLYERLQMEGRILGPPSGNNLDKTNFVTRMDSEVLSREYNALVAKLYSPRNYYSRVKTFLARYNEPEYNPPLNKEVLLAVVRCLFCLGLRCRGRWDFWRAFFWTIFKKPESIQNFLTFAILGYHFRKVHENSEAEGSGKVARAGAAPAACAVCAD